jgi:hypothetical protein
MAPVLNHVCLSTASLALALGQYCTAHSSRNHHIRVEPLLQICFPWSLLTLLACCCLIILGYDTIWLREMLSLTLCDCHNAARLSSSHKLSEWIV